MHRGRPRNYRKPIDSGKRLVHLATTHGLRSVVRERGIHALLEAAQLAMRDESRPVQNTNKPRGHQDSTTTFIKVHSSNNHAARDECHLSNPLSHSSSARGKPSKPPRDLTSNRSGKASSHFSSLHGRLSTHPTQNSLTAYSARLQYLHALCMRLTYPGSVSCVKHTDGHITLGQKRGEYPPPRPP